MTSIDPLVCLFYATIVQEFVIVPQNSPKIRSTTWHEKDWEAWSATNHEQTLTYSQITSLPSLLGVFGAEAIPSLDEPSFIANPLHKVAFGLNHDDPATEGG